MEKKKKKKKKKKKAAKVERAECRLHPATHNDGPLGVDKSSDTGPVGRAEHRGLVARAPWGSRGDAGPPPSYNDSIPRGTGVLTLLGADKTLHEELKRST